MNQEEKIYLAIAVGYGKNQGVPHKSKCINDVSGVSKNSPQWFMNGVNAALLAPTARNKQKFFFELVDNKVLVKINSGIFSGIDMGIIKLHFEIGSGKNSSIWFS